MMTEERFIHTERTRDIALEIASYYDIDKEKVEITALLHDCAKEIPKNEMKRWMNKHNITLDEIEEKEPGLWHQTVSAIITEKDFGVNDQEILQAIRIHSTGDANMSLLAKIIYIADYIESWPDEAIMRQAKKDIDLALKEVMIKKINYIFSKSSLLHSKSLLGYNWITKCIQNR
ncbi:MAG: bis(5'-nucleosyl)-tetraphosphatase (symmetrical) YqeK [bacterium]|nr:bis(5'-nucleosyl)-tetraphosphatase (symmetrical) YqeK [bacterium]